jgi:hypothetical protein
MEPESSLPCSEEPATVSCPEPDESSPHPHTLFLVKVQFYHPPLGLPSDHPPSGFQAVRFYEFLIPPMRSACSAHLIIIIIFSEDKRRLCVHVRACVSSGIQCFIVLYTA